MRNFTGASMGNFYVNHCVRWENLDRVVEVAQQAGRTAYVFPTADTFVMVCDQDSDTQDENAIKECGILLSRQLSALVLAVLNHDDDILCYWLFEDGSVTAEYNSDPHYFDGDYEDEADDAEALGDPNIAHLCDVLHVSSEVEQVEAILSGDYLFAADRHAALVEVLKLPAWSVGSGYRGLENAEFPEGVTREDVRHIKV